MAFGQQSGPPASAKQVRDILELLQAAGHTDFRDARGPMGFTQRQAAGKFTRDEADELIAQLQSTEPQSPDPAVPAGVPALRDVPADQLAAELQHRGWIVVEP